MTIFQVFSEGFRPEHPEISQQIFETKETDVMKKPTVELTEKFNGSIKGIQKYEHSDSAGIESLKIDHSKVFKLLEIQEFIEKALERGSNLQGWRLLL